ncbi:MAG: hypothetical protein ACI92S_005571, partial [Planctomycetaceae bacterium]
TAGAVYRVNGPNGSTQELLADETGQLRGVTANLAGQYYINGEGTEPISVSTNLLSSTETTLASVNSIEFDEQTVASADEFLETDRPLWSTVTLLAFGFLLVEWWFFQRPRVSNSARSPRASPR